MKHVRILTHAFSLGKPFFSRLRAEFIVSLARRLVSAWDARESIVNKNQLARAWERAELSLLNKSSTYACGASGFVVK